MQPPCCPPCSLSRPLPRLTPILVFRSTNDLSSPQIKGLREGLLLDLTSVFEITLSFNVLSSTGTSLFCSFSTHRLSSSVLPLMAWLLNRSVKSTRLPRSSPCLPLATFPFLDTCPLQQLLKTLHCKCLQNPLTKLDFSPMIK